VLCGSFVRASLSMSRIVRASRQIYLGKFGYWLVFDILVLHFWPMYHIARAIVWLVLGMIVKKMWRTDQQGIWLFVCGGGLGILPSMCYRTCSHNLDAKLYCPADMPSIFCDN
jgi:hypothetical protein